MSGAAWILLLATVLGTLVVSLVTAWFAHRLAVESQAAKDRDQEAKRGRELVTAQLVEQSHAIATIAEAQRITTREMPGIHDRLTIVESGQHTLHMATELLKQEIRLWREWSVGRGDREQRPD